MNIAVPGYTQTFNSPFFTLITTGTLNINYQSESPHYKATITFTKEETESLLYILRALDRTNHFPEEQTNP